MNRANFWFVTAISNPVRYGTRYKLYEKFRKHVLEDLKGNLLTVECAFHERPFYITNENHKTENEIHVQVRTKSELWHKENLLNIGFNHLPASCQYLAWVDADIRFLDNNVIEETMHQLQHYDIVQMFHNALDMGPNGQVLEIYTSFAYCYQSGEKLNVSKKGYNTYWHPGYAYAARKSIIENLGGLIEFAIIGAADHHMSLSFIGKAEVSIQPKLHENYVQKVLEFQKRCDRYLMKNFGYVPGTIIHHFHGKKRDRKYHERWSIVIDSNYNPDADIYKNLQNVLELHKDNIKLREGLRKYFRSRNEDSIDLE